MIVAALETSARPPSVALGSPGGPRAVELQGERAHASDLLPALERLLAAEGLAPRALEAVLVGVGPGSYTGLRVGIATALGLARALAIPLRGLASSEVLAYAELEPGDEAVVLLDARQGALYHARYRREPEDVLELDPPSALEPAEAARRTPRDALLIAEPSALASAGLESHPRARTGLVPRASALLALGARRLAALGGQDPRAVRPLYLRAFQARARRR